MAKLSKLVVSTTNRHKKSKRNSLSVYALFLVSPKQSQLTLVQRSILEADQEEENEEAGDMNDDELNEHISRTAEETVIFRQIDLKREKDTLDNWRNMGNRGKPPLPLMQLEELPDCYKNDEPFEVKEVDDVIEGRGQRRRTVVSYNDGLDDDAWAIVGFTPIRYRLCG